MASWCQGRGDDVARTAIWIGRENGRAAMFDLVLRRGRVLDPGTGQDQVTDIAFADGKVAAVGAEAVAGRGRQERDVGGAIVIPGVIDFHTHVYWGGTAISVEADALA